MPEHNLPGLVHAHHVAPRVAPGHGIDGGTEERERQASGGVHCWALPLITEPGHFEALSEPISSPVKWAQRAVVRADPSSHGKTPCEL